MSVAYVSSLGRWTVAALAWRALALLRAMGLGVVAGAAAGLVAGGIGSRLAMKVVALVAGAAARGRITENGNTIGDFTAEGTIFLLAFGAALGTVGGLLYVALRPWLLPAGRWRGLGFGALLLAIGRAGVIDSHNFDFTRFGSPALNVALFAALALAFGLLVAPLADWLDRRAPRPEPARVAQLGAPGRGALLAVLLVPALLTLGLRLGRGASPVSLLLVAPPLALLGLIALAARLLPAGTTRWLPRFVLYPATLAAGLLGFAPLGVALLGFALSPTERVVTRLTATLTLALLAGALLGRRWVAPNNPATPNWRTAPPLILIVLFGLFLTLGELATILTGG